MITPADLRRTLAKLADNHAQNQAAPVITPLDLAKMHRKKSCQQDSCEEQNVVDIPLFSKDDSTAQDSGSPEDNLQKHLLSQAYLQHLCHHADRQILLQLLLL